MISQKIRALAPEQAPLRMGMGWTVDDLGKPQIMVESTFDDSHPGSAHLLTLVDAVALGVSEAGGNILQPISATAWRRGTMESITLWPAETP